VLRFPQFVRNLFSRAEPPAAQKEAPADHREDDVHSADYIKRYCTPDTNGPPPPPSQLESIFVAHDGRVSSKWRHYFRVYEEEFGSIGRPDIKLLEIGVADGGSLQIWRKYLGEQAVILGVDINPASRELDTDDLPVRVGSQNDPEFLRRVVAEMGGIDIVIDDGSHHGADQIASFKALFPLLAPDGVYIIEDVHAAYWHNFGGGIGRSGTIMSFARDLIDDLHGWYHPTQAKSLATAKEEIGRIAFYDSIIAIRKIARGQPQMVTAGKRTPRNHS
jgi:hypothetical protein